MAKEVRETEKSEKTEITINQKSSEEKDLKDYEKETEVLKPKEFLTAEVEDENSEIR